MKQNHVKLEIFKDFSRETLVMWKRLWYEVVRSQKQEGKFPVINYVWIYSKFLAKKIRITGSFHMSIKNEYWRLWESFNTFHKENILLNDPFDPDSNSFNTQGFTNTIYFTPETFKTMIKEKNLILSPPSEHQKFKYKLWKPEKFISWT